jgi:hypothetical protein
MNEARLSELSQELRMGSVSDFIKNNYKLEVFEDTSWLFQK